MTHAARCGTCGGARAPPAWRSGAVCDDRIVLRLLAIIAGLTALCAACAAARGATAPGGCGPAQISGAMTVQRGSAGAGQITYVVRLRNRSKSTCTISGIPGLRLLDRKHRALPTHQRPQHPGVATAILVTLAPGTRTHVAVRFSPDVPGPGEQTIGRCEPVAHYVRVTLPSPAHGTITAPVSPPTSVCSHGAMTVGLLTAAG